MLQVVKVVARAKAAARAEAAAAVREAEARAAAALVEAAAAEDAARASLAEAQRAREHAESRAEKAVEAAQATALAAEAKAAAAIDEAERKVRAAEWRALYGDGGASSANGSRVSALRVSSRHGHGEPGVGPGASSGRSPGGSLARGLHTPDLGARGLGADGSPPARTPLSGQPEAVARVAERVARIRSEREARRAASLQPAGDGTVAAHEETLRWLLQNESAMSDKRRARISKENLPTAGPVVQQPPDDDSRDTVAKVSASRASQLSPFMSWAGTGHSQEFDYQLYCELTAASPSGQTPDKAA